MTMHKLAILLVSAALAAGCAQKTKPDDDAMAPGAEGDDGFMTQPLPEGETYPDGRPAEGDFGYGEDPEGLLSANIIYFDFDSTTIRPEYSEAIAAHAAKLVDTPAAMVRLEGHTDERGSREYNIGLGERRAQSVRRALMLQGVGGDQLSTVSYGEEQPAVTGSDEEAMAMNRRVEIIYLR